MIEHLMSSSLSDDHQGCAAGFIRLHVGGLRSHQWLIARELIARVVVCATGAVHTDIFRSIRYLPSPVSRGALNRSRGQSARTRTYRPIESREQPRGVDGDACHPVQPSIHEFRLYRRQPLPNRVTSELPLIRPESMPSAEITSCKPTW